MKKKNIIIIVGAIIVVGILTIVAIGLRGDTSQVSSNSDTQNTTTEQSESLSNTEESIEVIKDHDYYYDEDGLFDCGWDEAGITRAEDAEDGILGFKVMYNDDGTTYLIYNKDGSRYDLMDVLPNGDRYYGTTEADQIKLDQMYWGN